MYVCICNSVTDSDIRNAVSHGAATLEQLAERTGCSTACGCCREYAEAELQAALRKQARAEVLLPVWQAA